MDLLFLIKHVNITVSILRVDLLGAKPQPNLLYKNNGKGYFTEIGHTNSLTERNYYSMGVAWLDYNNDGYQDIYVANDGHPNSLFENNGKLFVNHALVQSVA